MEDASYYRYVSVYLGLALMSLLLVLARRLRSAAHRHDGGLRPPPGPWQLPVIGSLHHLLGKLPHRAMRDLARRHGPVMLLRLGEVPTVVVSSADGAREVMKTHDTTFATRPLSATMRVISNGGRDIAFGPYGGYWRQLRKIAVTELLTAHRVRSFRGIREEEVAGMLRSVAGAAAAARPIEMRERLTAIVADTTLRAVIGDGSKDRDAFIRELNAAMEPAAGFSPANLWPSSRLAGRLSTAVRRAEEVVHAVHGILDGIIQEHTERLRDGGEAQDLLDVLLTVQKNGGLEFPLDMVSIKGVIFDIFSGGTETAATTMEWAMAEMIRNPKVMQKATAEVRRAFKSHGMVSEDGLGELRYLHLVIRETLRLHTPVPLLLPRECQESCRVLGYDVPRGAQVLVNASAIGRDERYWSNGPEEFRPERFDHEAASVDFKGTNFEYLPFGAGRRMCPGMAFGLANVQLGLASLLFHFDWKAPDGTDPTNFDTTEEFKISVRRKAHLLLCPVASIPIPII